MSRCPTRAARAGGAGGRRAGRDPGGGTGRRAGDGPGEGPGDGARGAGGGAGLGAGGGAGAGPPGAGGYVPPGWPAGLVPPAAPQFADRATAWLLDQCPADFRGHAVLRRHPLLLARMAEEQVSAAVAACRAGYRTARADLGHSLPPEAVEAALVVYEREGRRLSAALTGVRLVRAALSGELFVPRL